MPQYFHSKQLSLMFLFWHNKLLKIEVKIKVFKRFHVNRERARELFKNRRNRSSTLYTRVYTLKLLCPNVLSEFRAREKKRSPIICCNIAATRKLKHAIKKKLLVKLLYVKSIFIYFLSALTLLSST